MSTSVCNITLVHGTFAKNAPWTRDGSALRTCLRDINNEAPNNPPVHFHNFLWSGWPTHLARHKAGMRLQDDLRQRTAADPDARNYIVAHSHGGNIALYALRDPLLARRIDGVITLSTPFLVARRRLLSIVGKIALVALGVGIFVVILAFVDFYLASTIGYSGRPKDVRRFMLFVEALKLPSFILPLGLYIGAINVLGALYKKRLDWFSETLDLPKLREDQIFIVRSPADEPGALLAMVQFLELFVTMFWGRSGALDRLLRATQRACKRTIVAMAAILARTPNSIIVPIIVWSAASFLMLSLVSLVHHIAFAIFPEYVSSAVGEVTSTIYDQLAVWPHLPGIRVVVLGLLFLFLAPGLSFCLIVVLFVVFLWALPVLLGATIGLFVVCASFVLALLMVVIVPEIGPFVISMTVSAESTPPGDFRVLHITTPSTMVVQTLMHSITYDSDVALKAIQAWILTSLEKSAL